MTTTSIRKGKLQKLKVSSALNYGFFTVVCLISILPFIHLLAKSLSDSNSVMRGEIIFWPKNLQFNSYLFVLYNTQFWKSLSASLFLTIVGTIISVFSTALVAYPLSKPYFKGRKLIINAFVFAWMCGPSIVPLYLVVKYLGLMNSLFSAILVDAIYCFNLLLMKTFFQELPESICEAAQMDGASNIRTFFTIVIPLSTPILATISVFSAFGYWNMYFYPYLFITSQAKEPLQLYLYDIISASFNMSSVTSASALLSQVQNLTPDVVRSATIFISMLPIMLVYPFLQKYFVKGLLIGAVKG